MKTGGYSKQKGLIKTLMTEGTGWHIQDNKMQLRVQANNKARKVTSPNRTDNELKLMTQEITQS